MILVSGKNKSKRNPTFYVDIVMFWYGKRELFIRAGSCGGPAKIGSELNLKLNLLISLKGYCKYHKIPKISPGAYIFQRPFLRGLFLEGLIFVGACLRREICVSKSIGLAL